MVKVRLGKRHTLNILHFLRFIGAVICFAWFGWILASYIEVLAFNTQSADYSAWNFFEVMLEVR